MSSIIGSWTISFFSGEAADRNSLSPQHLANAYRKLDQRRADTIGRMPLIEELAIGFRKDERFDEDLCIRHMTTIMAHALEIAQSLNIEVSAGRKVSEADILSALSGLTHSQTDSIKTYIGILEKHSIYESVRLCARRCLDF